MAASIDGATEGGCSFGNSDRDSRDCAYTWNKNILHITQGRHTASTLVPRELSATPTAAAAGTVAAAAASAASTTSASLRVLSPASAESSITTAPAKVTPVSSTLSTAATAAGGPTVAAVTAAAGGTAALTAEEEVAGGSSASVDSAFQASSNISCGELAFCAAHSSSVSRADVAALLGSTLDAGAETTADANGSARAAMWPPPSAGALAHREPDAVALRGSIDLRGEQLQQQSSDFLVADAAAEATAAGDAYLFTETPGIPPGAAVHGNSAAPTNASAIARSASEVDDWNLSVALLQPPQHRTEVHSTSCVSPPVESTRSPVVVPCVGQSSSAPSRQEIAPTPEAVGGLFASDAVDIRLPVSPLDAYVSADFPPNDSATDALSATASIVGGEGVDAGDSSGDGNPTSVAPVVAAGDNESPQARSVVRGSTSFGVRSAASRPAAAFSCLTTAGSPAFRATAGANDVALAAAVAPVCMTSSTAPSPFTTTAGHRSAWNHYPASAPAIACATPAIPECAAGDSGAGSAPIIASAASSPSLLQSTANIVCRAEASATAHADSCRLPLLHGAASESHCSTRIEPLQQQQGHQHSGPPAQVQQHVDAWALRGQKRYTQLHPRPAVTASNKEMDPHSHASKLTQDLMSPATPGQAATSEPAVATAAPAPPLATRELDGEELNKPEPLVQSRGESSGASSMSFSSRSQTRRNSSRKASSNRGLLMTPTLRSTSPASSSHLLGKLDAAYKAVKDWIEHSFFVDIHDQLLLQHPPPCGPFIHLRDAAFGSPSCSPVRPARGSPTSSGAASCPEAAPNSGYTFGRRTVDPVARSRAAAAAVSVSRAVQNAGTQAAVSSTTLHVRNKSSKEQDPSAPVLPPSSGNIPWILQPTAFQHEEQLPRTQSDEELPSHRWEKQQQRKLWQLQQPRHHFREQQRPRSEPRQVKRLQVSEVVLRDSEGSAKHQEGSQQCALQQQQQQQSRIHLLRSRRGLRLMQRLRRHPTSPRRSTSSDGRLRSNYGLGYGPRDGTADMGGDPHGEAARSVAARCAGRPAEAAAAGYTTTARGAVAAPAETSASKHRERCTPAAKAVVRGKGLRKLTPIVGAQADTDDGPGSYQHGAAHYAVGVVPCSPRHHLVPARLRRSFALPRGTEIYSAGTHASTGTWLGERNRHEFHEARVFSRDAPEGTPPEGGPAGKTAAEAVFTSVKESAVHSTAACATEMTETRVRSTVAALSDIRRQNERFSPLTTVTTRLCENPRGYCYEERPGNEADRKISGGRNGLAWSTRRRGKSRTSPRSPRASNASWCRRRNNSGDQHSSRASSCAAPSCTRLGSTFSGKNDSGSNSNSSNSNSSNSHSSNTNSGNSNNNSSSSQENSSSGDTQSSSKRQTSIRDESGGSGRHAFLLSKLEVSPLRDLSLSLLKRIRRRNHAALKRPQQRDGEKQKQQRNPPLTSGTSFFPWTSHRNYSAAAAEAATHTRDSEETTRNASEPAATEAEQLVTHMVSVGVVSPSQLNANRHVAQGADLEADAAAEQQVISQGDDEAREARVDEEGSLRSWGLIRVESRKGSCTWSAKGCSTAVVRGAGAGSVTQRCESKPCPKASRRRQHHQVTFYRQSRSAEDHLANCGALSLWQKRKCRPGRLQQEKSQTQDRDTEDQQSDAQPQRKYQNICKTTAQEVEPQHPHSGDLGLGAQLQQHLPPAEKREQQQQQPSLPVRIKGPSRQRQERSEKRQLYQWYAPQVFDSADEHMYSVYLASLRRPRVSVLGALLTVLTILFNVSAYLTVTNLTALPYSRSAYNNDAHNRYGTNNRTVSYGASYDENKTLQIPALCRDCDNCPGCIEQNNSSQREIYQASDTSADISSPGAASGNSMLLSRKDAGDSPSLQHNPREETRGTLSDWSASDAVEGSKGRTELPLTLWKGCLWGAADVLELLLLLIFTCSGCFPLLEVQTAETSVPVTALCCVMASTIKIYLLLAASSTVQQQFAEDTAQSLWRAGWLPAGLHVMATICRAVLWSGGMVLLLIRHSHLLHVHAALCLMLLLLLVTFSISGAVLLQHTDPSVLLVLVGVTAAACALIFIFSLSSKGSEASQRQLFSSVYLHRTAPHVESVKAASYSYPSLSRLLRLPRRNHREKRSAAQKNQESHTQEQLQQKTLVQAAEPQKELPAQENDNRHHQPLRTQDSQESTEVQHQLEQYRQALLQRRKHEMQPQQQPHDTCSLRRDTEGFFPGATPLEQLTELLKCMDAVLAEMSVEKLDASSCQSLCQLEMLQQQCLSLITSGKNQYAVRWEAAASLPPTAWQLLIEHNPELYSVAPPGAAGEAHSCIAEEAAAAIERSASAGQLTAEAKSSMAAEEESSPYLAATEAGGALHAATWQEFPTLRLPAPLMEQPFARQPYSADDCSCSGSGNPRMSAQRHSSRTAAGAAVDSGADDAPYEFRSCSYYRMGAAALQASSTRRGSSSRQAAGRAGRSATGHFRPPPGTAVTRTRAFTYAPCRGAAGRYAVSDASESSPHVLQHGIGSAAASAAYFPPGGSEAAAAFGPFDARLYRGSASGDSRTYRDIYKSPVSSSICRRGFVARGSSRSSGRVGKGGSGATRQEYWCESGRVAGRMIAPCRRPRLSRAILCRQASAPPCLAGFRSVTSPSTRAAERRAASTRWPARQPVRGPALAAAWKNGFRSGSELLRKCGSCSSTAATGGPCPSMLSAKSTSHTEQQQRLGEGNGEQQKEQEGVTAAAQERPHVGKAATQLTQQRRNGETELSLTRQGRARPSQEALAQKTSAVDGGMQQVQPLQATTESGRRRKEGKKGQERSRGGASPAFREMVSRMLRGYPQEEQEWLLPVGKTWALDIFSIEKKTDNNALVAVGLYLLLPHWQEQHRRSGLGTRKQLPSSSTNSSFASSCYSAGASSSVCSSPNPTAAQDLVHFLQRLQSLYNINSYHNSSHAALVTHFTVFLARLAGLTTATASEEKEEEPRGYSSARVSDEHCAGLQQEMHHTEGKENHHETVHPENQHPEVHPYLQLQQQHSEKCAHSPQQCTEPQQSQVQQRGEQTSIVRESLVKHQQKLLQESSGAVHDGSSGRKESCGDEEDNAAAGLPLVGGAPSRALTPATSSVLLRNSPFLPSTDSAVRVSDSLTLAVASAQRSGLRPERNGEITPTADSKGVAGCNSAIGSSVLPIEQIELAAAVRNTAIALHGESPAVIAGDAVEAAIQRESEVADAGRPASATVINVTALGPPAACQTLVPREQRNSNVSPTHDGKSNKSTTRFSWHWRWLSRTNSNFAEVPCAAEATASPGERCSAGAECLDLEAAACTSKASSPTITKTPQVFETSKRLSSPIPYSSTWQRQQPHSRSGSGCADPQALPGSLQQQQMHIPRSPRPPDPPPPAPERPPQEPQGSCSSPNATANCCSSSGCSSTRVTTRNKRGRGGVADEVTLCIAAVGHDVGHPGYSNAFLVATHQPVALVYNDKSVLENYHAYVTCKALSSTGSHGRQSSLLKGMTNSEYRFFRKQLIELILATDMSQHFSAISSARVRRENPSFNFAKEEEDRWMMNRLCLKLADIGHAALDWPHHFQWSMRLSEEFYLQGDAELRAGLPVSPLCDRRTTGELYTSQVGFITYIVLPLIREFVACVDAHGRNAQKRGNHDESNSSECSNNGQGAHPGLRSRGASIIRMPHSRCSSVSSGCSRLQAKEGKKAGAAAVENDAENSPGLVNSTAAFFFAASSTVREEILTRALSNAERWPLYKQEQEQQKQREQETQEEQQEQQKQQEQQTQQKSTVQETLHC